MLHLIPAPLHRVALKWAHRVRHRWRTVTKARLAGVSVVVSDLEGRILLVRHSYGPEGWSLPMGGMRRGEEPEAAARRELAEETRCQLDDPRVIETIEETISGAPHTGYLVTGRTMDRPRPDKREIVEAKFFPVHSLPEPQTAMTRVRIAAWKARRD